LFVSVSRAIANNDHLLFKRLPVPHQYTETDTSDSELKVQRYGMKKNTLTLDPIMLEDEL